MARRSPFRGVRRLEIAIRCRSMAQPVVPKLSEFSDTLARPMGTHGDIVSSVSQP
jgi:hypothetical protein